jgi:nucleoside-diphosphate-sugar epimerase
LQISGRVDQIYNLACPASPIDYQKLPLETLFASAYGTKNILDLAVEKKAIFLHASTSEVYGDPLEHPQKETYFGNVNCIGSRSCYDEGKRYAESLIVNYAEKYDLNVKIVRIFNTYGPRMRKNDGRVIPNFIQQALFGQPLTIYGDGSQTRSFCYVSDMVDGISAMMAKNDFRVPVNLGNSSETSILSLAEHIIRLTKSNSALVHQPLHHDDPKMRRPDISLAQASFHFQPKIDLEEGLQMTVNWFKNS